MSNSVSFKSRPIREINLAKNKKERIGAVFTELLQKEDRPAIQKIYDSPEWDEASGRNHLCGDFIARKPDESLKFYAIELADKTKELADRIVGLFNTEVCKDNDTGKKFLDFSFAFAKPSLKFRDENLPRGHKGIGENMLAETFRIAKEQNFDTVAITSTNNPFYEHSFKEAKLKNIKRKPLLNGIIEYRISGSEFDKYIDYVQKKYGERGVQQ
jgi:hypothetical protein